MFLGDVVQIESWLHLDFNSSTKNNNKIDQDIDINSMRNWEKKHIKKLYTIE